MRIISNLHRPPRFDVIRTGLTDRAGTNVVSVVVPPELADHDSV